jgi:small subunit ribosomal protein S21
MRRASIRSNQRIKSQRLVQWWFKTGRGVMSVAEVRLQEGESVENALRRFKRKVIAEDIIKEVKRHSFYLKPGAKRRVKQALARKRARKKLRKESDGIRN